MWKDRVNNYDEIMEQSFSGCVTVIYHALHIQYTDILTEYTDSDCA